MGGLLARLWEAVARRHESRRPLESRGNRHRHIRTEERCMGADESRCSVGRLASRCDRIHRLMSKLHSGTTAWKRSSACLVCTLLLFGNGSVCMHATADPQPRTIYAQVDRDTDKDKSAAF